MSQLLQERKNTKVAQRLSDFNQTEAQPSSKNIVYSTQNLDLWYGDYHALKNISLDIEENTITAIIGPSGCGKST